MSLEAFTIDDTEIVSSESQEAIRQSFGMPEAAPSSDAPAELPASPESGPALENTAAEASEDDAVPQQQPGEPTSSYQRRVKERNGFQERIGDLTKKRRAAETERDDWKRKYADLEARLAAPSSSASSHSPEAVRPAAPQAAPAPKTGEPKFEDYANEPDPYLAYQDARTEWRVTQALETERQRVARERQQEVLQQRMAAARAKHPDFDSIALNPQTVASALMLHVCQTDEQGLELAYYLGSHPDESKRIAYLPDQVQLMELGAIRASLSRSTSAPPSVAAGTALGAAPVTKAKPPIQPVRSTPVATDDPPDDAASDDEHVAYWDRKDREARRR